MRYEVRELQGDGFSEVAVTHNGEELLWSTGTYSKVRLANPSGAFDEINAYIETLPHSSQRGMFEHYREIKRLMEDLLDLSHIAVYIKKEVEMIYAYIQMDDLSKWLLTHGNLYIPSDVKASIDDGHRHKDDQTYLTEDYINLATLALAMRPILPIWGAYIDQGGMGYGNDLYKEMDAFSLITGTELMLWPKEQPAIDKLEQYLRILSEQNEITLSSIWKGMGSAEVPQWLVSNVAVRRLTILPLTNDYTSQNIVANIYGYVGSKLKPSERRASDRVTAKRPSNQDRNDDDKTSFLEDYKIKQRVPEGDVVLFNTYTENVEHIYLGVDPEADLEKLHECMKSLEKQMASRIGNHQILLAQWVCARMYPPKALHYINKISVCRLLAITQALLWQWGYTDLACLMQVHGVSTTDQDAPGITARPRPGTRISRKYMDELMELYPHTLPQKGRDNSPKNGNLASMAINTVTKDIMNANWKYIGPDALKKQGSMVRGVVVIPPEIKNIVTELVIHLAKINC